MRLAGKGDQVGRDVIGACYNQAGRDALFDLPERAGTLFRPQVAQVIEFSLTQYLHPIWMNQVEVADEPIVGCINLVAVEDAIAAVRTANATELQPLLLVFEQLPDVNLAHQKTSINLLRNSIAALHGARSSPTQLVCLVRCAPCALLSNCSLRLIEVFMPCCSSRKTTDECWRHLRRRAGDCGTAHR